MSELIREMNETTIRNIIETKEETIMLTTPVVPVNPVAQYYKAKKSGTFKETFGSYFSNLHADENLSEDIQNLQAQMKKLRKQLEEKNEKLKKDFQSLYSSACVQDETPYVLNYVDRGGNNHYAIIPSGEMYTSVEDLPEGYIIFSGGNKVGEVTVPIGYVYELGAILVNKYTYRINAAYDFTKFVSEGNALIGILDDLYIERTGEGAERKDFYARNRILGGIKAKSFIKYFYGRDIDNGAITLRTIADAMRQNQAAEIIIRTAPDNLLSRMLEMRYQEAAPVFRLLGFSKETWNKILENNLGDQAWELKTYIRNKEKFNKTEEEWLDLMITMKAKEEDCQFYHISYEPSYAVRIGDSYERFHAAELLGQLAWAYDRDNNISKNYSFGKFCNYVVEETINQGYTRIRDFIEELQDYLRMCEAQNIKPSLYSAYLKQTHDICARNHSIMVEEAQEQVFQNVYKDIKPVKLGEYTLLPPQTTKEVQQEGDNLNHCVASYIKRIIDGKCLIMFLRKVIDQSLVTVEIRDGRIAQARGASNRAPSPEEKDALLQYAKKANLKYDA